ncbi:hypothetical protein HNR00_003266 [Methylorubrum rhodinum]|uniref:Uncharacterized protein n=1 Tax=Methylorubrum rhodinum TaxID=29428 RepID=A0A840ZMY3_9HYPH|nr:hypothetical protein [Methylorubrum rhodinum]MBB5758544.1 hypothetical protein [Methylorubrum rhodinum]
MTVFTPPVRVPSSPVPILGLARDRGYPLDVRLALAAVVAGVRARRGDVVEP